MQLALVGAGVFSWDARSPVLLVLKPLHSS